MIIMPRPKKRRVKPRKPVRSRTESVPARPGMVARPVRKRAPHAGVERTKRRKKLRKKARKIR